MSTTIECNAEVIQSLADASRDHTAWLARGRELAADDSNRCFQIGDWLVAGEEKWSRKAYTDAAGLFTSHTKETLRNLAHVARSVQTSSRNDALSWSHHAAVARFAKAPETQKELLACAAKAGLSVSAFRKYVDEKYPVTKACVVKAEEPTVKPDELVLTVPPDTLAALETLALTLGDEVEAVALSLLRWALQEPEIAQKLKAA